MYMLPIWLEFLIYIASIGLTIVIIRYMISIFRLMKKSK